MPEELQAAGVKATLKPSSIIETFEGDWEKDWFTYRPQEWPLKTHKLYDPVWAAPAGAKLMLDVRSAASNKLVIGIDQYAAEVELSGGSEWQKITLSPADFIDVAGEGLPSWNGVMELRFGDKETLKDKQNGQKLDFGGIWQGAPPEFRDLRWSVE
ncbi:hypothetical protein P4E94_04365 [Pontiellaceae bacterium B12219]|nr:hypothetical protein [Pontiellaceae bacterium B12219]